MYDNIDVVLFSKSYSKYFLIINIPNKTSLEWMNSKNIIPITVFKKEKYFKINHRIRPHRIIYIKLYKFVYIII